MEDTKRKREDSLQIVSEPLTKHKSIIIDLTMDEDEDADGDAERKIAENNGAPIVTQGLHGQSADADAPPANVQKATIVHGIQENVSFPVGATTAKKGEQTQHAAEPSTKPPSHDNRTYSVLQKLENSSGFITNPFEFDCSFCFIKTEPTHGVILRNCLHNFCKDCIIKLIDLCEDVKVNCPFTVDNFGCTEKIQNREIRGLLSKEKYDQYCQKRVNANSSNSSSSSQRAATVHGIQEKAATTSASTQGSSFEPTQHTVEPSLETEPPAQNTESQTYLDLKRLEHVNTIVTNNFEFECSICCTDIEPTHGITLRNCLHTFCKDCIIQMINMSEDIAIKCPFSSDNFQCTEEIQDREVRGLLSAEQFEKYLMKTINFAERNTTQTFHCKLPNCVGWCECDDQLHNFRCPVCHSNNCINCGAIHSGKDCRQYQDELTYTDVDKQSIAAVEKLITTGEAMRCPKCKIIIVKREGCDGLTCIMCKTLICWATKGYRWGPKGHGDISGGCRCNVGGKRCHPTCRFCH